MARKVHKVDELEENGPQPATEFNNTSLTHAQRKNGVSRFDLGATGNRKVNADITPVFYLIGTHSAVDVVDAFLDANSEAVDTIPERDLSYYIGQNGGAFTQAYRELTGDPRENRSASNTPDTANEAPPC